jgi:hypothetical protein
MAMMTKADLIDKAYDMTGGSVKDFSTDQLRELMTVTQFVTDLCLNEIEDRGELSRETSTPIVPYQCEYMLETILTRGSGPHQADKFTTVAGHWLEIPGSGSPERLLNAIRERVEREYPAASPDELEDLFLVMAGF